MNKALRRQPRRARVFGDSAQNEGLRDEVEVAPVLAQHQLNEGRFCGGKSSLGSLGSKAAGDRPWVPPRKTRRRVVGVRGGVENTLRQREARERLLSESLSDVVWSCDAGGRLFYVSPNVERVCGFAPEEFLGKGLALALSRVHPEDLGRVCAGVEALQRGGTPLDVECRAQRRDDRWIVLRVRALTARGCGEARTIDGICTEVTERRRLEEQLQHAQRMEDVGQRASAAAHDFNNLLSVILSYSQLASESLMQDDPLRSDLREIQGAAERAAELTRQLMTCARPQDRRPRTMSLNDVLGGMERMLRCLLARDIELSLLQTSSPWTVCADSGQIEQVIMNLAVNARDAMPRGGALRIETHNVRIEGEPAHDHAKLKPGDYVMLSMTDSGEGMDDATRARIFEPFFTTKAIGKGSGLGLSTVVNVVAQSGGHVEVDSEPGRGTTFKVYLPRSSSSFWPTSSCIERACGSAAWSVHP